MNNVAHSLFAINKQLSQEWHPTKNGEITPDCVTPGSSKKVWWQCLKYPSHEWEATIVNRHSKKSKCPYCAKKRAHSLYCLGNNHPEIAKEWHPTKNTPLTPYDVTPGSDKKVWWICPKNKNHEYEARVYSRSQGRGCPICSGRKVDETNSLAKLYPSIAKQWHSTKNGERRPEQFTAKSGEKVWWQCPRRKHEWKAVIASRVNGTDCPKCYSQSSRAEYRLLSELELFFEVKHRDKVGDRRIEADILIEELKLVIELDGKRWHEEKENKDINKNRIFIDNDYRVIRLRDKNLPNIDGSENIQYDSSNIKITQIKKILENILLKDRQKITNETANNINNYINNCFEFRNQERYIELKALPNFNGKSFKEAYPELAKEWHPTKNGERTPDDVPSRSNEKIWWICSKGHEWYRRIADAKGGCPYCAKKRAHSLYCLGNNHPEIAKEWHPTKNTPLTPYDVTPGSDKKVWWICPKNKNHEYEARVYSRSQGRGCPICSGRKVDETNSLAKLYPEIAKEWHPYKNGDLKPTNVIAGSKKKVWWRCLKDTSHEYQMIIGSKTKGYKCPICSGRKVDKTTCLAIKNPWLAKEWHKIKNEKTPHDFTTGSKFKAWWICPKCKHEYQSLILSRSHGHGCPACSNKAKKERAIKRWTKYKEDKLREVNEKI